MLTCNRGSGGVTNRGNLTGRNISTCPAFGATTDPDDGDACLTLGATPNLVDGDACSGRYESGSGTLVVGLTVRALVPARGGNELGSLARFAA